MSGSPPATPEAGEGRRGYSVLNNSQLLNRSANETRILIRADIFLRPSETFLLWILKKNKALLKIICCVHLRAYKKVNEYSKTDV